MKKRLLLALLLACTAPALKAQYVEVYEEPGRPRGRIDTRQLRFGAFFAPNLSWMKPTASKSDDGDYRVKAGGSQLGYTWGLMIDYFFTENYGIATGVQVNTTGGHIESNRIDAATAYQSTVYRSDFEYNLQYLEVPFALKLRSDALSPSGFKFFGQLGLTAGANISKKATYVVSYLDENYEQRVISSDREKLTGSFAIAPLMLQLNVGGGFERPISQKMSAYFGVFFNNGFAPDATNPGKYDLGYQGEFSDGHIRLNSFAFRFGLFF